MGFAGLRSGSELAAVPQALSPVRASAVPVEVFMAGPIWWSYHPSESSYMIITAVLLQVSSVSEEIDRVHEKVCSSSASEYPA
jgi:hypothetical protein